jgi:NAD(P)H dehydrogenase (quinone)
MNYVVTGATGQLGRLVVEALLSRGTPGKDIVATGRDLSRISDLGDRGVRLLAADFDDPASLREAFSGAEKLLLVSGSEVGRREVQHQNAIDAARDAGVGLIVYTSIANADRSGMALAAEHQFTEKALAESGVGYSLLRNAWYLENYTGQLATYLEYGVVLASAGAGRVSAATRADYADAAAAVLLAAEDQAGKVYELGGDEAFSLAELADAVSDASGQAVSYRNLSAEDYTAALVQAGLPEPFAATLADSDLGIARGELLVETGDLARLIGRPATSMPEAIRAAV